MTKFIRLPKPRDPLQALIDANIQRRLDARRGKEKHEPVPAVPVGTEALFDLSAFVRANPIAASILEVR
jgi:hypothetical protein